MTTQTPITTPCSYCGKPLPPDTRRKYCNGTCRANAARKARTEAESSPASLWAALDAKASRMEALAATLRAKADKFKPATV